MAFSLPACPCGLTRSSLWSVDRGREGSSMVYRRFCMLYKHHWKAYRCSTTSVFWNIPGQREGEILPVSRASSTALQWLFCLEGKMARFAIIYPFVVQGQWLGWWSGTWKELDWKLVTRRSEEWVCGQTSQNGHRRWRRVSCMDVHQRGVLIIKRPG